MTNKSAGDTSSYDLRILRALRRITRSIALHSRQLSAYRDRKSTRLNSSHVAISYAVFCLKKKKRHENHSSLHPICFHSLSYLSRTEIYTLSLHDALPIL